MFITFGISIEITVSIAPHSAQYFTFQMLSKEKAQAFAVDWIDSWNSHNLERILSHYSDDFCMTSPFIARIASAGSGTLYGKDSVRSYWEKALIKYPDLRFELIDVLFSVNTICIYYNSILGLRAVEWLKFNSDGQVIEASGSYNDVPK
jgi:ketosteroid isomerase-like protein